VSTVSPSGAQLTSYGIARTASDASEEDATAEQPWEEPLTRLLLLMELADRPAWLRDLAHPAPSPDSAGLFRRAG